MSTVRNKDASIFKQPGFCAVTVIRLGCLHCVDVGKNVVIYLSARAWRPANTWRSVALLPTRTAMREVGEKDKVNYYNGTLSSSLVFVPFCRRRTRGGYHKGTSLWRTWHMALSTALKGQAHGRQDADSAHSCSQ